MILFKWKQLGDWVRENRNQKSNNHFYLLTVPLQVSHCFGAWFQAMH